MGSVNGLMERELLKRGRGRESRLISAPAAEVCPTGAVSVISWHFLAKQPPFDWSRETKVDETRRDWLRERERESNAQYYDVGSNLLVYHEQRIARARREENERVKCQC
jgi:hypothetical protein